MKNRKLTGTDRRKHKDGKVIAFSDLESNKVNTAINDFLLLLLLRCLRNISALEVGQIEENCALYASQEISEFSVFFLLRVI